MDEDGSLGLNERLQRIEDRQDAQGKILNRIMGGILLMGAGMPFVLFFLDRLWKQ